ncbi:MAG: DVU0524 family FlgM-associated protein [Desulfobacteria bacterium]
MAISTYHIHNVLRTYSRQLSKSRRRRRKEGDARRRGADWISICARARRKAVIDKVTSDIVNRIIRKSPRNDTQREISRQVEDQGGNGNSMKKEDSELSFKLINKEKGEVIRTIFIEDSKFLKDQLEESGKSQADN